MKRLMLPLALGLALAPAWAPAAAPAPSSTLSLERALVLAEGYSPSLKAALARERGSREAVRSAQSSYLPTLDAAAVDSTGFPGSATGLDGFDGLVASPYRRGAAADAFSKWDLMDATVWHAVAAAHFEVSANREAVLIERESVDQQALRVYLEAVLYRGYGQAWYNLVDSLKGVRDTVARFVRNGQYSEVQSLLIEDQLDDADLKREDFDRSYKTVLQRLGLLTGLDPSTLACPAPEALAEGDLSVIQASSGESPLVLRARDQAQAAKETAKQVGSESLPKIELGGSAGLMQGTRLEDSQDYSAFAGVTVPLFEGFRINADARRAAQEEEAESQEVLQARLALDDLNARLDEQVDEARNDLQRLLPEQERAARAVALARSRYLSFLGPLSDLQQALKDRVSVDSQIAEVRTQLFLALGTRALVNGGLVNAAH